MEEQPILNAHNKDEYPPAHTAEHILNQTMVRMFGCSRSRVNHIGNSAYFIQSIKCVVDFRCRWVTKAYDFAAFHTHGQKSGCALIHFFNKLLIGYFFSKVFC